LLFSSGCYVDIIIVRLSLAAIGIFAGNLMFYFERWEELKKQIKEGGIKRARGRKKTPLASNYSLEISA